MVAVVAPNDGCLLKVEGVWRRIRKYEVLDLE